MSLIFHEATPRDIPLLNHLMREGKGHWGYPEERLDVFMTRFGIADEAYFDNAFGFIATFEEDVIGEYLFKVADIALELDHFFLNTRFIGQGYGRQLWEHCVTQARQKGWDHFMFWADPHSLKFYEHMGAVKIGERPMVTMPGYMAPVMLYNIVKE